MPDFYSTNPQDILELVSQESPREFLLEEYNINLPVTAQELTTNPISVLSNSAMFNFTGVPVNIGRNNWLQVFLEAIRLNTGRTIAAGSPDYIRLEELIQLIFYPPAFDPLQDIPFPTGVPEGQKYTLSPFKTKSISKHFDILGYEYPVFEETYDAGGLFVVSRKFNVLRFGTNGKFRSIEGLPPGITEDNEENDSRLNTGGQYMLSRDLIIETYEAELVASRDPRDQLGYKANCFNGWKCVKNGYILETSYLIQPVGKIVYTASPGGIEEWFDPEYGDGEMRSRNVPRHASITYYNYAGNGAWELVSRDVATRTSGVIQINTGVKLDTIVNVNADPIWVSQLIQPGQDYRDFFVEEMNPEDAIRSPYLYVKPENSNLPCSLTIELSGATYPGQFGIMHLQSMYDEGYYYHDTAPEWSVDPEEIPVVIPEDYALPALPKTIPATWLYPPGMSELEAFTRTDEEDRREELRQEAIQNGELEPGAEIDPVSVIGSGADMILLPYRPREGESPVVIPQGTDLSPEDVDPIVIEEPERNID